MDSSPAFKQLETPLINAITIIEHVRDLPPSDNNINALLLDAGLHHLFDVLEMVQKKT